MCQEVNAHLLSTIASVLLPDGEHSDIKEKLALDPDEDWDSGDYTWETEDEYESDPSPSNHTRTDQPVVLLERLNLDSYLHLLSPSSRSAKATALLRLKEQSSGESSVESSLECKECGKRFRYRRSLSDHMKTHNASTSSEEPGTFLKCPQCSFTGYPSKVHAHFVTHTNESPYVCQYCQKDFTRLLSVQRHIRLQHPSKLVHSGFTIKQGSIFNSPRPWTMLGYDLERAQSVERPFQCNLCKIDFVQKAHIQRHFTEKHQGSTSFKILLKKGSQLERDLWSQGKFASGQTVCPVCDKDLLMHCRLICHVVGHTEHPYACLYCSREFIQKGTVRAHVKEAHPEISVDEGFMLKRDSLLARLKGQNDGQGECEPPARPARKRMTGRQLLGKPRKSVIKAPKTTGRRIYACGQCPNFFRSRSGWSKHVKKHNDDIDGPFPCPDCGRSFCNEATLTLHRNRKHDSTALPYHCKLCKWKFARRDYLRKHQLKHAALAPHQCRSCKRRFKLSAHLKKHMQRWHSS